MPSIVKYNLILEMLKSGGRRVVGPKINKIWHIHTYKSFSWVLVIIIILKCKENY